MGMIRPDLKTNSQKEISDVLDNDQYKSGHFYASESNKVVGKLIDQDTIFDNFRNEAFQDNAYSALTQYLN